MQTSVQAALAALVLFLAGCASEPPNEPQATLARGSTGRRSIVFVVDGSAPAEEHRAAAQAALETGLILSGSEGWSAGVLVARDREAQLLVPLEPLDDKGRGEAAQKLSQAPRIGRNGLAQGVRRALDALVMANAAKGSWVVVLTANPDDRDLPQTFDDLARRGHRATRIALDEGARPAAARLAEEAFGYVRPLREDPKKSVTLGVGGGRLAWVSLEGAVPPTGKETAGSRSWKVGTASALVWTQAPTRVRLLGGEVPGGLVLYKPGWEIAPDPEAPPPIAPVGQPVRLNFSLRGGVEDALVVTAKEGPVGAANSPVALKVSAGTLSGTAPAPPWEGSREVALELAFAAGETDFAIERRFTYAVRRAEGVAGPAVQVSPGRLDLGVVTTDANVSATISLRGDPSRPTRFTLEGSSYASAAPVTLAPGETRSFAVSIDPARVRSGEPLRIRAELEGPTTGRVRPRAPGDRPPPEPTTPIARVVSVPVAVERKRPAPPPPVTPTLTLEPAELTLKGSYGWAEGRVRVSSNVAGKLQPTPGVLAGPGARITPKRDVRLVWDGKRDLLVRVYLPSDLPPGRYEGTVDLALGAARRPLKVAVEVER